jgi:hypothetical protein
MIKLSFNHPTGIAMTNSSHYFMKSSLFAICFALASTLSQACDSQQQIRLTAGNTFIDQWTGTSDQVRAITLPNNFKLGVKIEETSREKYEDFLRRTKRDSVPELVRISLYDMTEGTPRLITKTWGGANSKQGYGSGGGADRVDEVGDPGIVFEFSRANCTGTGKRPELTAGNVSTLPTAAALKQIDEQSRPSTENLRGEAAALADAKAGNYRIVYPDAALSSQEISVMKRVFDAEGLQLIIESKLTTSTSAGFNKGYKVAMMNAVRDKLGIQKMKAMEASIKAGIAELNTAKQ